MGLSLPFPRGVGKSTDFDITLFFRLLRTMCSLPPPATGWDVLPVSTDHSLTADLARIKYHRNAVYGHVNQTMEIANYKFPLLWQEISETLVRIAGQISNARKTEWQRTIDKFLKDPLTSDDERNVEELERWYNDEIEVKKSIEDLKNTTEEVREEIVRLGVKLREETRDNRECSVFADSSPRGHRSDRRNTSIYEQTGFLSCQLSVSCR